MIMRQIRHTGIYVDDISVMKDFYCTYFDMEVAVDEIEEGNYIETVLGVPKIKILVNKLVTKDGCMLELIKCLTDDGVKRKQDDLTNIGTMHIAFSVSDVDSMYDKMCKDGNLFISKPEISASGKAKVCFCKDPEGNYIELVEEI